MAAKASQKTKAKAQAGEVDLIVDVAHKIENLSDAGAAAAWVQDLSEGVESNYFALGGLLVKIDGEGWFQPHEDFRTYCEETGVGYRKARYLMNIYTQLMAADISWPQVAGIGWTKLRVLHPVLTVKNAEKWIAKAQEMSVRELADAVQKYLESQNKSEDGEVGDSEEKTSHTFKVKLHDDQYQNVQAALDKAKSATGTEFESVALDAIAQEFLSGAVPKAAVGGLDLFTLMKNAGMDEVLENFEKLWPEVELTVGLPE